MIWENIKVLVIGGGGYLGSVLVQKLVQYGFQVDVLDNMFYWNNRRPGILHNRKIGVFEWDIRDFKSVRNIMNRNYDVVIHLAAIVGDQACDLSRKDTVDINVAATKNIVDSCLKLGVKNFVFASTCSVYGSRDREVIDEDSPTNPVSLYGKTKVQCEDYILSKMGDSFNPVIFRMGTLFGMSERMRFDLVVNTLTAKAVSGEPITIFGGNQFRPHVHVSDAAKYYCAFAQQFYHDRVKPGVYNLVGQNKRIMEVGEIVNKVCGGELLVDDKLIDERNYFVVSKKLRRNSKYFGLKKSFDLKRGVQEVRDYLLTFKVDYRDPVFSNFKSLHDDPNIRRKVYGGGPI